MTYVYALIIMIIVTAIMASIYAIVFLVMTDKKKVSKRDIILSYVKTAEKRVNKNSTNGCEHCDGKCEEFVDKYLSGDADISDCACLDAFEKDSIERLAKRRNTLDPSKVAFVFCKGGSRSKDAFKYNGVDSCACQKELFGGCELCKSGCLGCMDCAKICPTGAIFKNKYGVAEVDRKKCIACGKCVGTCPNDVIGMIPLSQEIAVICNVNSERLKDSVSNICSVGCTACGKCKKVCKYDAIRFKNGYVEIDESKCKKCKECIYACPNRTISRLNIDL